MTEIADLALQLNAARTEDRAERRDDQKRLHKRIDLLGETMGAASKQIGDLNATVTGVTVKVETHEAEIQRMRKRKSYPPGSVKQAASDAAHGMSWKQIGAGVGVVVTLLGSCSAAILQSISTQETVDERTQIAVDAQLRTLAATSRALKAQSEQTRAVVSFDEVKEAKAADEAAAAEAELAATVAELLSRQAQIAKPEARPAIQRKAKAAKVHADELAADLDPGPGSNLAP
jgi:hypothetical protein